LFYKILINFYNIMFIFWFIWRNFLWFFNSIIFLQNILLMTLALIFVWKFQRILSCFDQVKFDISCKIVLIIFHQIFSSMARFLLHRLFNILGHIYSILEIIYIIYVIIILFLSILRIVFPLIRNEHLFIAKNPTFFISNIV
jgi:hypothetical protein